MEDKNNHPNIINNKLKDIISERLSGLIKKSEFTQDQISQMAHISRQSLCKFISKSCLPRIETLYLLSEALNVPLSYFLPDDLL